MSSTLGRDTETPSKHITNRIFGIPPQACDIICGSTPENPAHFGRSELEETVGTLLHDNHTPAKDFQNLSLTLPQYQYAFLTKPTIKEESEVYIYIQYILTCLHTYIMIIYILSNLFHLLHT